MAKIAIEESLSDVKSALEEKGHDVVDLREANDAKNVEYAVITGGDRNVMGMQDTITQGTVIDASGMTADQICEEVEQSQSH